MKNKKSDNSNAVIIGVFIFIMLALIFASYYKPENNSRKGYRPASKTSVKPASEYKILKSERPASKLKSSDNTVLSTEKASDRKEAEGTQKPGKINPNVRISEESLEKNAARRKNSFINYHKPFLKKLGVPADDINNIMNLYSGYNIEKEKIYKKYDRIISDKETLLKLEEDEKLYKAGYDSKIKKILGKKNYELYDVFEKSLAQKDFADLIENMNPESDPGY